MPESSLFREHEPRPNGHAMPDYQELYRNDAARYDRMVAAEDADGAVLRALAELVELRGAHVVEVGLGTGRITRELVRAGARVVGVEPVDAMLSIAKDHVASLGADKSGLVIGSLDALPFPTGEADLAVAGWVFGHQRSYEPLRWRETVGVGIAEMTRVLRPGGALVLFETLGTALDEPFVRAELAELHSHFEASLGLSRRVIRTDYAFASAGEAADTLRFFFGDAVAARILERSWARVPEWTGVWSKRVD